ncbi:T9SS type A sorting domain-containing protein [Hymenobacter sp. DH14]|uniref:T9SS type A sorting domain-containing protein n=1 Tax=Hymenobacter cyanobacteriorum TaxID=2926463 RepID=A0A9X1VNE8_9BACT|nr:T9SS type A sorting domain-containing protein [Hymenobacter cyanobacteriorum]MCI1189371.1 T9SS type A sorting domain-containing protein [Hymenobacter cyanobacteriorum]
MKQLLLSLGVVLLSLPGHAQFTRTYNGALTLTNPTIPGDRLFRDGTTVVCGAAKAYPGTSAAAGVHYNTYTVANTSATATNCVTITLAPNCTDASGSPLFVSVYTNAFNPANLTTNYKSDMGSSTAIGTPLAMGVTLAANERVVIVVSGVTATSICNAYSLTVAAPIALPVTAGRDLTAKLSIYPNPVADLLHITASKAGSYTLYNALGAVVRRINSPEVSLADLPTGIYQLQHNDTKETVRVVKD